MSVGAVSGGSSPLDAMFRRVAESRKSEAGARAEEGSGATPTVTALRKQLAEAQETLNEHVRAGVDEQTIRMDKMKVQALAAALASVLDEQAKAAREASGAQYI